MLTRSATVGLLLCALLLLAACASHGGYETRTDGSIEPFGFFSGFLHGLLFPLALIGFVLAWCMKLLLWIPDHAFGLTYGAFFEALANRIYFVGQPNTGGFYYLGFVIGLSQHGG